MQRSIAGSATHKSEKSPCIASSAINVLITLTTIACVSLKSIFLSHHQVPLLILRSIGLNTCVGKANYTNFFRTMISITLLLFVHGAIQLALLIDKFVGNGDTKARAESWFQVDATIPIVAVISIFLLFDLASFSLMFQLLTFHLKLQREGLTTYAYIVRDNQRRREKTKADNELAAKRGLEIEKAKEEGRLCHQCHLEVGGYIGSTCGVEICDPLRVTLKRERTQEAAASQETEVQNGTKIDS